ncbi:MAG: SRPBCC domain-containing protein [Chryseolinea sp.]
MNKQNFTAMLLVDQSPKEVFNAVTNVRGWWSEEIEGETGKLNDEFSYQYRDIHSCKVKLTEVIPDEKVVWHILDNYFNFTKDKREWKDTKVIFEISKKGNKTQLQFTHDGLVPDYECYEACSAGWTQYVKHSLLSLITTGKGQPNANEKPRTPYEVAARFNELAKQEKWFEIQDELFDDNVKSIEPANAPYLKNAEGKDNVRKKGEEWGRRVDVVNRLHTSEPVIGSCHFAVGRNVDIDVQGIGRVVMNQIMLYEVKHGKIVKEQFFY